MSRLGMYVFAWLAAYFLRLSFRFETPTWNIWVFMYSLCMRIARRLGERGVR